LTLVPSYNLTYPEKNFPYSPLYLHPHRQVNGELRTLADGTRYINRAAVFFDDVVAGG
jgi:hypothetical protein